MAANGIDEDPNSPKDDRLVSLETRLERVKAEEAAEDKRRHNAEAQRVIRSAGSRILSVLVGYPLGGALIGWAIDQYAGTLPWVTLGLMFLGFGLAFREVLKTAKQGPTSGREVK
ncbi:AtpZ/AtpI family protein [Sphingomonas mesophila]|uniref:AtpZ/AtpI family protein n=1 Tax=Sphingomonas mesophila TaxID=2303576 RepID=UPI0013C2CB21|nr:AtpZ/AtpI family protein [Sphingomonas mesophila]